MRIVLASRAADNLEDPGIFLQCFGHHRLNHRVVFAIS